MTPPEAATVTTDEITGAGVPGGGSEELISGMLARGYRLEFAQRLYEQIKGFGSYGFPESHSASFALLAYASAYLKRHHPAAFVCGLLNSLPMGFYGPAQLIQDAAHFALSGSNISCSVMSIIKSQNRLGWYSNSPSISQICIVYHSI